MHLGIGIDGIGAYAPAGDVSSSARSSGAASSSASSVSSATASLAALEAGTFDRHLRKVKVDGSWVNEWGNEYYEETAPAGGTCLLTKHRLDGVFGMRTGRDESWYVKDGKRRKMRVGEEPAEGARLVSVTMVRGQRCLSQSHGGYGDPVC